MTPLRPEDLNVSALPRSSLGHLKTDAVADLLQRAAWDYREALALNQRLAAHAKDLTQRVEELTAQVSSLEEAAARRKDPDELARTLLASAQRAAREERESARREAELMLKKAARRAEWIERDGARRAALAEEHKATRAEAALADARHELAQLESGAARLRSLIEETKQRAVEVTQAAIDELGHPDVNTSNGTGSDPLGDLRPPAAPADVVAD